MSRIREAIGTILNGGNFRVVARNESDIIDLVEVLRNEKDRRELGSSRLEDQSDAMSRIEAVCDSFHRSALRLRSTNSNRKGIEIKNEYRRAESFVAAARNAILRCSGMKNPLQAKRGSRRGLISFYGMKK